MLKENYYFLNAMNDSSSEIGHDFRKQKLSNNNFNEKRQLKMYLERQGETICPLCDAKFYRKYDLKAHISTVHEGKKE